MALILKLSMIHRGNFPSHTMNFGRLSTNIPGKRTTSLGKGNFVRSLSKRPEFQDIMCMDTEDEYFGNSDLSLSNHHNWNGEVDPLPECESETIFSYSSEEEPESSKNLEFLESLMPKEEIQVKSFLQENPSFDGRGVIIAILGSGFLFKGDLICRKLKYCCFFFRFWSRSWGIRATIHHRGQAENFGHS